MTTFVEAKTRANRATRRAATKHHGATRSALSGRRSLPASLYRGEAERAARLVEVYGKTLKRLEVGLSEVLVKAARARQRGDEVTALWVHQEERFQRLIKQAERELQANARTAGALITQGQSDAVKEAHTRVGLLLKDVAVAKTQDAFAGLPVRAIDRISANTAPGRPLDLLLEAAALKSKQDAVDALVLGLATGKGPRSIAQELANAIGGNLQRALTISRTEVLRSYNDATLQGYREHSDVVEGWYWLAELDDHTCPACVAMDGTLHTLDEQLDAHVNCRCTMEPTLVSGGLDPRPVGAETFDTLSEEEQAQIFDGRPGLLQAYYDGRLTMDDDPVTGVVVTKSSPVWGDSIAVRALKDLPPEPDA